MSSVLSEYPETLPAPMIGVVVPTERRKISSLHGVQNFRTVQRDRHGTRTYAFTFTREQAAIFREWWAEWEQLGGGWFAANWPLPWSRGPNVFRFKGPPAWYMIGGGNTGQGYWKVSGTVEIRGRGMLPTVDVLYLTSTLYPILSTDSISAKAINFKDSPIIQGYIENIGAYANVLDISSRDIYQIYKCDPENLIISGSVSRIFSDSTEYITIRNPAEEISLDASVIMISARNLVIKYGNYAPESLNISSEVKSISATGS